MKTIAIDTPRVLAAEYCGFRLLESKDPGIWPIRIEFQNGDWFANAASVDQAEDIIDTSIRHGGKDGNGDRAPRG